MSCTRNILKPSEDVCFDWLVEVTASFCTICVELKKSLFFVHFNGQNHTVFIFWQGLRATVNKHVQEQLTSHTMDMVKEFAALKAAQSSETEPQRNAPRRTRGGMESRPQEQASQEVYVSELSTQVNQQRNEIDEMKRIITGLNNTVHHQERRLEEVRMRQERPIQELTLR